MFALVDCNSFFCAVERVFHPDLRDMPVCVLSNNDGCIVALTPEAKALGLKRGDPLFKVRDVVAQGGVRVFSGNLMLYAAMSRRINRILRHHIHYVETYSIDECFCNLQGYDQFHNLADFMRTIANTIDRYTGIPVSVGIAPTKTLAKMGSKFAKQYKGYRAVCLIDTEEKRRKALGLFPLADVWGIGRNTLRDLQAYGVNTPLDLAEKSETWVRSRFNLPVVRTWMELRGIPCIDTAEPLMAGSITTSRSFGQKVTDLSNLREAVAHFTAACANKLRARNALAGTVSVFVSNSPFAPTEAWYGGGSTRPLFMPTADTLELTRTALDILTEIYRPGIPYKKAGVILSDIVPASPLQLRLFDPVSGRSHRRRLMQVVDGLNHRFGLKRVHLAVEGDGESPWHVKCAHRTPDYLTDINQLLTVNI